MMDVIVEVKELSFGDHIAPVTQINSQKFIMMSN